MATAGSHSGLNLGPLLVQPGNFTGINLGVHWNDEPPEPVIRGLRKGVDLGWTEAAGTRTATVLRWGLSPVLVKQCAWPWGQPDGVRIDVGATWGITPWISGDVGLYWRQATADKRSATRLCWSGLPVQHAGLDLRWGAYLFQARQIAALVWGSGPRTSVAKGLAWAGKSGRRGTGLRLRWGHPDSFRRDARLPWGGAKPVPWIVRPPAPTPDPDPDPGEPTPPGNLIGLNLGCSAIGVAGLAPLNLGVTACYLVRPQRRTYVVINSISVVRLPDRTPIEVESVSISSSVDAWGSSFDLELADVSQLPLLKPTAAGPRLLEITLNGYVWTTLIESYGQRREWSRSGVTLAGRSRTALLAAPYAPGRVKTTTEDRSAAQLVAEELVDTGFSSTYDTVDWLVPAGAWFYDATPALDAISRLAEASGGVVQSHPADASLRVRARYPHSPWDWRDRTPDHVVQEDIVSNESLQIRSAPLYDAVVVTGELAGKGVTCKVRRSGEAGQLFAQQVSNPLINTSAVAAERGRNILADRGEQAAVDLVLPLFTGPLRPGEVGRILPLDLVEVVGESGMWHGLCTAVRTEARIGDKAAVVEQTITLERHYTDAD